MLTYQMLIVISNLTKRLITVDANIWAVAGVHANVIFHVAEFVKHFGTIRMSTFILILNLPGYLMPVLQRNKIWI